MTEHKALIGIPMNNMVYADGKFTIKEVGKVYYNIADFD